MGTLRAWVVSRLVRGRPRCRVFRFMRRLCTLREPTRMRHLLVARPPTTVAFWILCWVRLVVRLCRRRVGGLVFRLVRRPTPSPLIHCMLLRLIPLICVLTFRLGFFSLPRRILESGTALAHYLRTSLVETSHQGDLPPDTGLWPCPPPFVWRKGLPPRSGRLRSRWRLRRAEEILVNCIVIGLSHLALRETRFLPSPGTGWEAPQCGSAIRCDPPAGDDQAVGPPSLHSGRAASEIRAHS